MIEQMFKEIDINLNNECYISALSLALMLPDICGKAEYPSDGNKKRYTKWCEKYIEPSSHPPKEPNEQFEMPYLNAELIYSLRCNVLHSGNPDVDKDKNDLVTFILSCSGKNDYGFGGASASVDEKYDSNGNKVYERSYWVDVSYICTLLRFEAEDYYVNNKEKFSFLTAVIKDKREENIYEYRCYN